MGSESTSLSKRLAVFDLDGTILRGNSWQGFFFWSLRQRPTWAPALLLALAGRYCRLYDGEELRKRVLLRYKGRTRAEMTAMGERFVQQWALARIRPGALKALSQHKEAGHSVILVSASFDFLAQAIARHLGLQMCLATRLYYHRNLFSGHLETAEMRGKLKVTALRSQFEAGGVDWQGSTAYADEDSDYALLNQVGDPVYIGVQPPERLSKIKGLRCLCWD